MQVHCVFIGRVPYITASTERVKASFCNVELLSARVPLLLTKCGLQPDDVVQDLASSKSSAADIGWLRYFWDIFLNHDIFAVVNKNDRLIQIHSTAEQFDPIAENLFWQIPVSCNNFSNSYCMHRMDGSNTTAAFQH